MIATKRITTGTADTKSAVDESAAMLAGLRAQLVEAEQQYAALHEPGVIDGAIDTAARQLIDGTQVDGIANLQSERSRLQMVIVTLRRAIVIAEAKHGEAHREHIRSVVDKVKPRHREAVLDFARKLVAAERAGAAVQKIHDEVEAETNCQSLLAHCGQNCLGRLEDSESRIRKILADVAMAGYAPLKEWGIR